MLVRLIAAGMIVACGVALAPSNCCAQSMPLMRLSTDEHKAVVFYGDAKSDTKLLSALALDGWEYVGPLAGNTVAFRRHPAVAQRVQLLGTWELVTDNPDAKGQFEFTRDNRIKLISGSTKSLQDFLRIERFAQGNAVAFDLERTSYDIRETNMFGIQCHPGYRYGKMRLDADSFEVNSFEKDSPTLKFRRVK